MLIGTLIAHHTDTTDGGEQDGTSLPDLIIERHLDGTVLHIGRHAGSQDLAGLFARELHLVVAQTFYINIIGILQDSYLLWRDVTQDTDGKTWAWGRDGG